jgi:hypothetical protein
MKLRLVALALLALALNSCGIPDAFAQPVRSFGPLGYCQMTSLATAKSLVPANCSTGGVPASPFIAEICVSGAAVRYTSIPTITPTATIGIPVSVNTCFQLSVTALSMVQFIQQAATATIDIEFFQ